MLSCELTSLVSSCCSQAAETDLESIKRGILVMGGRQVLDKILASAAECVTMPWWSSGCACLVFEMFVRCLNLFWTAIDSMMSIAFFCDEESCV